MSHLFYKIIRLLTFIYLICFSHQKHPVMPLTRKRAKKITSATDAAEDKDKISDDSSKNVNSDDGSDTETLEEESSDEDAGHKRKSKKTVIRARIVWQWLSGKRWVAYHPDDIALLEEAYTDGEDELKTTKLSFGNKHTVYVLDFLKMTQTNEDTKKVRSIRRATFEREPSGTDDEVGYAKLVKKHSTGLFLSQKNNNHNNKYNVYPCEIPQVFSFRTIFFFWLYYHLMC